MHSTHKHSIGLALAYVYPSVSRRVQYSTGGVRDAVQQRVEKAWVGPSGALVMKPVRAPARSPTMALILVHGRCPVGRCRQVPFRGPLRAFSVREGKEPHFSDNRGKEGGSEYLPTPSWTNFSSTFLLQHQELTRRNGQRVCNPSF